MKKNSFWPLLALALVVYGVYYFIKLRSVEVGKSDLESSTFRFNFMVDKKKEQDVRIEYTGGQTYMKGHIYTIAVRNGLAAFPRWSGDTRQITGLQLVNILDGSGKIIGVGYSEKPGTFTNLRYGAKSFGSAVGEYFTLGYYKK